MLMRKIALTFVGLVLTTLTMSQTQNPELVSSGGDSFKNSTYQLDWSVGEGITETLSGGNNILTQGFHQSSYEITAIYEIPNVEMNVLIYPNPTSDFISLKVESSKVESMQYTITDLSGKVLATEKLHSTLQTLNFTNYSAGTYLISISQNNQLIKSFQIIKK